MDGLYALADAAGGALAAPDQAPAALPTPTSAISTFSDDEGSICNVGAVADVESFVVRAVALAPDGAPKLLSDGGLGDVLVFSIEPPTWFPAGPSGPTRMLNERYLRGVIVLMRPIAKNVDYIVSPTTIGRLARAPYQLASNRKGAAHTVQVAWMTRDATMAVALHLLSRAEVVGILTGRRAIPSEACHRPAAGWRPASGGRNGRGVCPAPRRAPAGRVRLSPPPPEPCACAPTKTRLTRAATQRPRAAREGARGTRRVADALTKPNVPTRAARADDVRPRLRAPRAADCRASSLGWASRRRVRLWRASEGSGRELVSGLGLRHGVSWLATSKDPALGRFESRASEGEGGGSADLALRAADCGFGS